MAVDERGDSPSRSERRAGLAVAGVVAFLALLGVAAAAGSFASYESVKSRLDSFASDGDADVSRADFDAIVLRLRIGAFAGLVAALAVHAGRRRVSRFLAELASSTATSARALGRGLARTLARESRLHLGALGLVVAVALLVRIEFLFQPMRYDESVTYVHYASQPWYIAATTYTAPNNHVLHSLLVHWSTLLCGGAPWTIRLPAFVAGLLLVPASYVVARALYGKHAALLAAALVAGSSVLVEYSTNARGYTLVALFFVVLLALATRLRTSSSLGEWLAFVTVGALGFYTVPVMLYGFGAVSIWLALEMWRGERQLLARRLAPAVGATALVSILLYTPVAAASGVGALVSNEFVEPLSWTAFADELPDSLAALADVWHRDVPLPLALVLAAGFAVAIVFHRRLSPFAGPPALAAVGWIVPVVVIQRVVPFERVWLFLVPLYLATAAAGLLFALRPLVARAGGAASFAVVLAVAVALASAGAAVATQSVYESEDTSTFRDAPEVASFLAHELRQGDRVLVWPPADGILEYELGRRGLDSAELLYWSEARGVRRLLVVVKESPEDYRLEVVLTDARLRGLAFRSPLLLRRYEASALYELRQRR